MEIYYDSIEKVWVELIPYDQMCEKYKSDVNLFDASTHSCKGAENLKNDHIAPQ